MEKDDYLKRPMWDHESKMVAYQMYNYGYDDPITAYQILTEEEDPSWEVDAEQMDFEGFEEEEE